MAYAEKFNEERIETVVTDIPRIRLTLSEDEADFLRAVLSRVGGDPTDSPREYNNSISDALRKLTGKNGTASKFYRLSTGCLWFNNYENESNA